MDRILIILKAPALGLNTIIFKLVYWYMQQTQVSVYRTIGPLVIIYRFVPDTLQMCMKNFYAEKFFFDKFTAFNLANFRQFLTINDDQ